MLSESGTLGDDVSETPGQVEDSWGTAMELETVEALERLAALRDAGAITDDEFARQKANLLEPGYEADAQVAYRVVLEHRGHNIASVIREMRRLSLDDLDLDEAQRAVRILQSVGATASIEEEPDYEPGPQVSFRVVLDHPGNNRIQVIAQIRRLSNRGLKEAAAVVDNAPRPVLYDVDQDTAERAVRFLQSAGAIASIQ